MSLRTVSQPDCWTNLSIGRSIVESGIPHTDRLSFEGSTAPWVDTQWLYDLLLYAVWSAGEAPLTILFHSVALIASFILLIPIARRFAGPTALSMALVMAAWLLAYTYAVKPLIFSLLFSALFINRLSSARSFRGLFLLLLPVQILWVNIDPMFVLGPIIVLSFAIQSRMLRRRGEDPGLEPLMLFVLAGILVLVTLVNPYGPVLHAWLIKDFQLAKFLLSWSGPSPVMDHFLTSATRNILYLSLIVAAGGLLIYKKKLPIAVTLLALITLFFAMMSFRLYDLYALFTFPFMALSFQSIGNGIRERAIPPPANPAAFLPKASSALVVVAVIGSLFLITTNRYYIHVGSFSGFGLSAVSSAVPDTASPILRGPGFPERAINLPLDGGFISWAYPERKVFVDNRLEAYGKQAWLDRLYAVIGDDPSTWDRIEERWDPQAVILNACTKNASLAIRKFDQSKEWKLAWFDGITAVYLRNLPAYQAMLHNDAWQAKSLEILEQERRRYAAGVGSLRVPPLSPRLVGAGVMYMSMNYYKEAHAVYDLLTRNAPNMHTAWLNRGMAALQLKQYEEAVHSLEIAAKRNGKNPLAWLWLSRAYQLSGKMLDSRAALERGAQLNSELANRMAGAWGMSGEKIRP